MSDKSGVPPYKGWISKESALAALHRMDRPGSEINQLAREWDAHIAAHTKANNQ